MPPQCFKINEELELDPDLILTHGSLREGLDKEIHGVIKCPLFPNVVVIKCPLSPVYRCHSVSDIILSIFQTQFCFTLTMTLSSLFCNKTKSL